MEKGNFYKFLFYVYYSSTIKRTFPIGATICSAALLSLIINSAIFIFWMFLIIFFEPFRILNKMIKSNYVLYLNIIVFFTNFIYFIYNNNYKNIINYYKNKSGNKINFLVFFKYYLIPFSLLAILIILSLYIRIYINKIPIR